ncbi:MAG: hypothetical protein RSD23_08140, partial [Ruthenibacterium sp.]
MFLMTSDFWFAVIRSMTPVLFATLAVSIASKSGVVNIAAEGVMLFSALTGVVASAYTQSLMVGMIAGWVDVSERHRLLGQLQEAKDDADAANRAKTT